MLTWNACKGGVQYCIQMESTCSAAKQGLSICAVFFFFQAEDGIRDVAVTGVQTCALPILPRPRTPRSRRGRRRTRSRASPGASLNELPDHGILRLLDLLHGSHLPDLALVQHGDAITDRIGAAHVVRHRSEEHTSELQSRLH